MKTLKYLLPLALTLLIISCSKEKDSVQLDETSELTKVQVLINDTHSIEVFTKDGKLIQGYNAIALRIKDEISGKYIENASISWVPVMHMSNKMHSCPKSKISKTIGSKTLYEGFVIFQMAENASEGWKLTLNYTIEGTEYTVTDNISVSASDKKHVTVFMDNTKTKYIVALITPSAPKAGTNEFVLSIHKMENMMTFPVVENYKIKQDPRMPSMGNHSSPNNTDLIFDSKTKMYNGDLSLTMTGYWKLNLMIYNSNNELIKGEAVTEENESSSLFLELEF
ncbi:MAG: hypothetical protein V3U92_15855 [Cellulophaga sp.]